MNAVDTNVLIYRLDLHEPVKRAKARTLLQQLLAGSTETILLWHVAAELIRHLRSWQGRGQVSVAVLRRYVRVYRAMFRMVMPNPAVLDAALDLTDRYSLSHWDSMILAACLEAGVDTLYTEDMGAPARYDTVQLLNPFV
jgi:predicted nucleic acid-binding protein